MQYKEIKIPEFCGRLIVAFGVKAAVLIETFEIYIGMIYDGRVHQLRQ